MMDTKIFHELSDKLFNDIEQQLDNYADLFDTDIDYETHGNVITISFENNSKIIINTQEPLFEIWMATPNQGYHFNYKNGDWVCNRSNETFNEIFAEAVKAQINE